MIAGEIHDDADIVEKLNSGKGTFLFYISRDRSVNRTVVSTYLFFLLH